MDTQRKMTNCGVVLSAAMIEKISLFGALDNEQLHWLLQHSHIEHYQSGHIIYAAGDPPTEIYVLLQGRIDIVTKEAHIHSIRQTLSPGDTLGETAVIGIQNQTGTAIVSSKSLSVLVISPALLMEIQQQDANMFAILMMNVARDLSRRLHNSL